MKLDDWMTERVKRSLAKEIKKVYFLYYAQL